MGNYDDIINLPAFKSSTRPQMSLSDRAAQFAPFKALTGYDESISETARITENKVELSEDNFAELNLSIQMILNGDTENITVEYFVKDVRKNGGNYQKHTGNVRFVDVIGRVLDFCDGTVIPFDDIKEISMP